MAFAAQQFTERMPDARELLGDEAVSNLGETK